MARAEALEQLLRQSSQVWTGRQVAAVRSRDTGFKELNAMLPGHGWPLSALIELIPKTEGIGELQLAVPALRRLCQESRDIVFVRPPHVPYPPALAKAGLPLNRIVWIETKSDDDARWAAEQTLRQGMAGAVLLWSDCSKDLALRRLQLAAREGEALAFLYRTPMKLSTSSPAALRLALHSRASALHVDILKAQGGRTGSLVIQSREAA